MSSSIFLFLSKFIDINIFIFLCFMTFVKARYYKYTFGNVQKQYSPSTGINIINIVCGVCLLVIAICLLLASLLTSVATNATFKLFIRWFTFAFSIVYVFGQGYKIAKEDSSNEKSIGFFQYLLLIIGIVAGILGIIFLALAQDTYLADYIQGLLIAMLTYFNMLDVWSNLYNVSLGDIWFNGLTALLLIGGVIAELAGLHILGLCILLILVLQGINYIFYEDRGKEISNDIYTYLPAIFTVLAALAALYIWLADVPIKYPWVAVYATGSATPHP